MSSPWLYTISKKSLAFYRDGLGLPTKGVVGTEFKDHYQDDIHCHNRDERSFDDIPTVREYNFY